MLEIYLLKCYNRNDVVLFKNKSCLLAIKEEINLKIYNAKDIRNVAIAGHGSRGKTTLAEAMLFTAGATDRMGRVADGNTVLDFDAEEKRRHVSVSSAVAPI